MSVGVPVAFIIFNRPDLTQIVFNRIKEARPSVLLVIADGPRDHVSDDQKKCKETRAIIETQINWECRVLKNYSDQNLGCKTRVSSGITWVFEHVEEAIILEDDCLVDLSFFRYSQELLEKYRENEKVMFISADHRYLPEDYKYSYNFIRIPFIWGWATWRRAWKHYDGDMKSWPEFDRQSKMHEQGWSKSEVKFYKKFFQKMYEKKIDTWDYQWVYAVIKNEGLCIQPCKNLVKNIGFRSDATHTKYESAVALREAQKMEFPLLHPVEIKSNWSIDHEIQNRYQALWPRVLNRLKSMFRFLS